MPSDIQFELVNKNSEPILYANLSAMGEAMTSARVENNESYIARFRAQRTGKILTEKKMTYSGSAPWLIQISLKDCSI